MLKLIKVLLILFLLLILALGVFIYKALESSPLVAESSGMQVNQADSVKALMEQISASLLNRSNNQDIRISEDQLNSLVGFAQRAHHQFSGKADISANKARISATYALPQNPLGRYVNLDVVILPADGIEIEHIKIGSVAIPGAWAIFIATRLADWYTQSDIATQFIHQVEKVEIKQTEIIISIRPIDAFLKELHLVKDSLGGEDDEALRARTIFYLNHLAQLEEGKQASAQSLATFMGAVFEQANARSNNETAYKENEAAILALAIYAGDHRFANFAGAVKPADGKFVLPKSKPLLAKRQDLNLHFIFSAAIKILSEQGLSIAIGEFKELMDRGKGGSGYSFIDLAADYAGIKFAQTATDPQKARQLQITMAGNTDEGTFFPSIKDLPEGLSKQQFMSTFKQVDSPEYTALVDEIHRRVDNLSIHQ